MSSSSEDSLTSAIWLIIDWVAQCSTTDQGDLDAHLVVGSWDIDSDELSEIVFPESWSNALLQGIVVGNDVSNICD